MDYSPRSVKKDFSFYFKFLSLEISLFLRIPVSVFGEIEYKRMALVV